MTREGFIEELEGREYSYEIEGDKLIVTHKGDVYLRSLTSLPPGVVFNNKGSVYLRSLTSLPHGVVFNNKGFVDLDSLTSLSPGVEFKNEGGVDLESLTSLPPGVVFSNGGDVNFKSIIGSWFEYWKGNIEGIGSNRLLNLMISKGIFQR